MAHITIIGKGNMGQAISSVVTKGGSSVELFGQDDTDKTVTGDIVVQVSWTGGFGVVA